MLRQKLKRRLITVCGIIILALGSGVVSSRFVSAGQPPLEQLVSNNGEVVSQIRGALGRNSSCITVRFGSDRDIRPRLLELADMWMDSAMQETDSPSEGDYIRYQYGGYESSYTSARTENGWDYQLKIVPKYYSYREYEEAVDVKVREIIDSFGFDESTSGYDKIRAVYDYVCSNVSYDRIHRKNENYYLRSTCYAALIWGSATCQGYCVAVYRLLREAGVSARIVTGTAEGEKPGVLHAWNIVELDGTYFNLDPTWDAGKEEYEYFLKGSRDFSDHTPGGDFMEADFTARYPIAEESYKEQ